MNARAFAESICRTLRAAGHQAYLVGGCVRDILLGREPADYDVATDATPDRVQQLFPHSLAVGAKFGVIIVTEDSANPAPLRRSRSPRFAPTSATRMGAILIRSSTRPLPKKTSKRRDFTINALLLDPETNEVLDFVGGRDDLRAGIIRAIGRPADRFREDKLRMVRAVRFAARFRYAIEASHLHCHREVRSGNSSRFPPNAFATNSPKSSPKARRAAVSSCSTRRGSFRELLPEIARMKGVEQPPQFHPEGDVWTHTLIMLEGLPAGCSPTLAWGVLLHDVGKPPTFTPPSGPNGRIRFDEHVEVGTRMAEEICRRFRFSNDDTAQIAALVANHMRFKDVPQMKPSTLKRFVRLDRFDEHLELHRLDCLSSHGHLDNYDFVRRFLAETPPEEVRPPRLLTGDDLIGPRL